MSGDSSFILKDSDPLLDPNAFQMLNGQGGGSVSSDSDAKYGSGGIGEMKIGKTPMADSSSSTSSLNKRIAYALGMAAIVGLVAVASVHNSHGGAYNSNSSMEVEGLASIQMDNSNMFGQTNLADTNVEFEVIPSANSSAALKVWDVYTNTLMLTNARTHLRVHLSHFAKRVNHSSFYRLRNSSRRNLRLVYRPRQTWPLLEPHPGILLSK